MRQNRRRNVEIINAMSPEMFLAERDKYPTDVAFAYQYRVPIGIIRLYRKSHGLQGVYKRRGRTSENTPSVAYRNVSGAVWKVGHYLTEEAISSLYAGRRYEDMQERT